MRRRFFNKKNDTDYDTDYSLKYFTIEVLDSGVLGLYTTTTQDGNNYIYYSINNQNWIPYNEYTEIQVLSNDKIRLKSNAIFIGKIGNERSMLRFDGSFNVYGNSMSLFWGDDFINKKTFPEQYDSGIFAYSFKNQNVKSAKNLILPADTLYNYCYKNMFYGCELLAEAPELPATTLANRCYEEMFEYCTSLTTAPQLPATTLASFCYYSMFAGCTSLTTAPKLPATTLLSNCYYFMFYGCNKLNYIKMLATDISASYCLYYWVHGVASSGTFVKHPNMTSLPSGASGIPSGWTVINDGEETGPNLITFYIDNTEYKAEEGMTWEEWVNSEYNTDGYILYLSNNFGDIYDPTGSFVIQYNLNNFGGQEASDLIESNHKYLLGLV